MTDIVKHDSGELANPDHVAAAIDRIDDFTTAKDMVDWTATLRELAARRLESLEEQNRYAELKLLAERKAGEILAAMQMHVGGRAPSRGGAGIAPEVPRLGPTLKELGINATQSSRWQRLASIPLDQFEAHLQHQKWEKIEITQAAALRLAGVTKRGSQQRRTVDAIAVVQDTDATPEDLTHLAAAALVRLTTWSYEDCRHVVGQLAAASDRGADGDDMLRVLSLAGASRPAEPAERWT